MTLSTKTLKHYLFELLIFTLKEARACIFAASLFALMALSYPVSSLGIFRYDFLFMGAIAIQILMVWSGLETKKEVLVIGLFHLIGLGLELFKTSPLIASWSYPEPGLFKLMDVPLFSGFMYAAVGSYVIQAWRLLKIELHNQPAWWISTFLAIAGYVNFFTKHYGPDLRWWIIGLVLLTFGKTKVTFVVTKHKRTMPLNLSFLLVAFFIWIAENISTFLGAWNYPGQEAGWSLVHTNKISSWFILFIMSFLIVVNLLGLVKKQKMVGFKRRDS